MKPMNFDIRSTVPGEHILARIAMTADPELRAAPLRIVEQPKEGGIILAASGPSLAEHLPELKALYESGMPVMSVSGSHDWLIERGIIPSFHAVVDGRKRVADYISNPHPDCTYLVASQAHPVIWGYLAKSGAKVLLWHTDDDRDETRETVRKHHQKFLFIKAGCTVGMASLQILNLLGWREVHCFGMDGCFKGKEHHVDGRDKWTVPARRAMVGAKEFLLDVWMVGQAQDFQKILGFYSSRGAPFDLRFYGEGLLSWIYEIRRKMDPKPILEMSGFKEGEFVIPICEIENLRAKEEAEARAKRMAAQVVPGAAITVAA